MDVKINIVVKGLNSTNILPSVVGYATITTQPTGATDIYSQQKTKMDYSPDTGNLSSTVPSGAVVELFIPMSNFLETKTIPTGSADILWSAISAT